MSVISIRPKRSGARKRLDLVSSLLNDATDEPSRHHYSQLLKKYVNEVADGYLHRRWVTNGYLFLGEEIAAAFV
jgi:hypothetical protein